MSIGPHKKIHSYEKRLSDTLNEANSVLSQLVQASNPERSTAMLSLLFKMRRLVNEAEGFQEYIKDVFPPIRLRGHQSYVDNFNKCKGRLRDLCLTQRQYANTFNTDFELYFPDCQELEDVHKVTEVVTESEESIFESLMFMYDTLLEILISIQAMDEDLEPERLALLYTQAVARYKTYEWEHNEEIKFTNHIDHLFPFGPPASDKIYDEYRDEYRNFAKTRLGRIYDENKDDIVSLAVDIAESDCSHEEFMEYLNCIHKLEKLKCMYREAADRPMPNIKIETFVNNGIFIDSSYSRNETGGKFLGGDNLYQITE